MPPKVDFLFDFGSPNAYLSEQVIPAIEKRTGATFDRIPVLLGGIFKATGNRSPVESFGGIGNKMKHMGVEMQRFVRKHGVSAYRHNPHFPVNTLNLMRGAIAAQAEGAFEGYYRTVFRAMWEDGKKMDDPAVFRDVLAVAGLDADRLLARSREPEIKSRLVENTQQAVERGAFGSPTFFVGREMFFGKDQLRDVEEEIVAQTATSG